MPRENKPSRPEDNPETLLQLILDAEEHDQAFADLLNDELTELQLLQVPVFDQDDKFIEMVEGPWRTMTKPFLQSGDMLNLGTLYYEAALTAAQKYIETHPELIPDPEEIAEGRAVDHEIERQKYFGDAA